VDIGCGNAILDFVLMSEGYKGWGFDARARKTWDAFPKEIGQKLKEMVLVYVPAPDEEEDICRISAES